MYLNPMTAPWRSIVLDGETVPYRIERSRRSRRLGLRVGADGLCVRLPAGTAERHAIPLIREHSAWVLKQLDRRRQREAEAYPTRDGRPLLLYRGREMPLTSGIRLQRVSLEGDGIVLRSGLPQPHRALEDWLRGQCREALLPAIAEAERKIGRRHSRLVLRDQKTRWGSCSSQGTLSFNWRLILAPDAVLDYVACHEVMHLAEPNHSAAFWDGVAAICPASDAARRWLKDNQHRLMVDLRRLVDALAATA